MKGKLLIFAIVLLGMGACTQKMCPTYANQDIPVDKTPQTEVSVRV